MIHKKVLCCSKSILSPLCQNLFLFSVSNLYLQLLGLWEGTRENPHRTEVTCSTQLRFKHTFTSRFVISQVALREAFCLLKFNQNFKDQYLLGTLLWALKNKKTIKNLIFYIGSSKKLFEWSQIHSYPLWSQKQSKIMFEQKRKPQASLNLIPQPTQSSATESRWETEQPGDWFTSTELIKLWFLRLTLFSYRFLLSYFYSHRHVSDQQTVYIRQRESSVV